jgi:hypothetical protein
VSSSGKGIGERTVLELMIKPSPKCTNVPGQGRFPLARSATLWAGGSIATVSSFGNASGGRSRSARRLIAVGKTKASRKGLRPAAGTLSRFDTHCGFLTLEHGALQCLMVSA